MHYLTVQGQWAEGSATLAMHCFLAWGQCAAQLLQRTSTPTGGSGQWNSWKAKAHQLGGRGALPRRRLLRKERYSCNALPHFLGAVGNGTLAIHCLTTWGQWAMELLQRTASLPRGTGQWSSCNAPADKLEGREVLPRRWPLPEKRTSYDALPKCLGALGSATNAMHCLTAWG